MSTINQLWRKERIKKYHKNKHFLLQHRPHKSVKCLDTGFIKPRKPNSAKRKCAKIGWFQSRGFFFVRKQVTTFAYVPGVVGKESKFTTQKNADLLIRGGKIKDLPGVKYTIVRGHKKSLRGLNRNTSRSKYGAKLPRWEDDFAPGWYKSFKYH